MRQKTKWLAYSVGGLLVLGFGLSLLGEAIIQKINQGTYWGMWGTAALAVTNAGVCLIGQAVIEKIKLKKDA